MKSVVAEVLERAALPAQSLPVEVAPRFHHLGGQAAALRRDDGVAEMKESEGQFVVLSEHVRVIDLSSVPWHQTLRSGPDDVPQRPRREKCRGARQDEDLSLQPRDVARVPGVLVALQHADISAAPAACKSAANAADAFAQMAAGFGDEAGGEDRVGVHHQDGVLVAEFGQQDVEGLIQRAGLLVNVPDGREDLCAGCFGPRSGVVSAVVRADDDQIRRRLLMPQRRDRLADLALLVVRGNECDDKTFPRRA